MQQKTDWRVVALLAWIIQAGALPCYAQREESARGYFISASAGTAYTKFTDRHFSQQPFGGYGSAFSVEFSKEGELMFHRLAAFYATGNATLRPKRSFEAAFANYRLLYEALRNLKQSGANSAWRFHAGLRLDANYTSREYSFLLNNTDAFDLILSLQPAGRIGYDLSAWLPGFSVSNCFAVSVVSLPSQSSFGTPNASGELHSQGSKLGNALRYGSVVGFRKCKMLANTFAVDKSFAGKHRLSLGYHWSLTDVNISRHVTTAAHRLDLAYRYAF